MWSAWRQVHTGRCAMESLTDRADGSSASGGGTLCRPSVQIGLNQRDQANGPGRNQG